MKFSLEGLLVLFFIAGFSGNLFCQKIDVYEGSFDALKGHDKVNVVFVYDNMSVGDYEKDDDYIMEKVNEKNEDEPGSGDEWLEKWIDDRSNRYEPKFLEVFNETLEDHSLRADKSFDDAENTLIIETTHLEPGYNVGISRKNAHIHVYIYLVTTRDLENTLGEARLTKVPGRTAFGTDFDTGQRISEAYAKTGQLLAKYLDKKVLK